MQLLDYLVPGLNFFFMCLGVAAIFWGVSEILSAIPDNRWRKE